MGQTSVNAAIYSRLVNVSLAGLEVFEWLVPIDARVVLFHTTVLSTTWLCSTQRTVAAHFILAFAPKCQKVESKPP